MAEKQRGRNNTAPLKATVGDGLKASQTKPQTPSGKVKPWQPPNKGTSPSNRKGVSK